jgi:hypothetical protein
MPNTFELIASSTVGASNVSSVTFNSIPNTFTDLALEVSARTTDWGYSYNNLYLSINGSPSGSSYFNLILYAVGTTTGSFGQSGTSQLLLGGTPSTAGTSSTFSNVTSYLPNYAGSTTKFVSSEGASERSSDTNGHIFLSLIAGLWSSTAAVSSLVLTSDSSDFVQHSSFYLYGIKNS